MSRFKEWYQYPYGVPSLSCRIFRGVYPAGRARNDYLYGIYGTEYYSWYEVQGGVLKETTVSIAGIDISFLYDEDRTEPGVGEDTNPGKETEGIKLHVHHGPLPDMDSRDIIFDSGQTWALFRSDNKYVLQNNPIGPDSSPDIFIVLNSNLTSGDIFLDYDPSYNTDLSDP